MNQAKKVELPSTPQPALHKPPAIDIGALIEANCCENFIEATMRVRALAEISRALDASSLILLARVLDDERGRELLLDKIILKAA